MLALLHTSPVHVPVFDALRDAAHPGLELRHHVHAELLKRARREGPEAVTEAVGDVLRRAVAQGARAVLCTCSTIGAVAESAAAGVPVLRVDRPMAAAAVAAGPRVVVLAALRSTLAPTAALVEEEAGRAGRPLLLRTRLVEGAWDRFEAGDTEGYLRLVAEAAEAVTADDTDVIVLAQASMAPAREVARTPVPVLASPALGLAAGAAAARLGHLDPAGSCGGVSAEAGVG
ncbi:aspartate/glutamate racemase family protein [Streptomyces parvulus]|uniref:aspartate/glutamate racemase family protein n=1 Tax=Streptomyces parvulus TaxID=146923 RepID=UPI00210E7528|nr:aspartate/glutamate racemase family protein [Streptomyces parvulus]MCQ4197093.1 aspartate/glutamate racemase family protein [Streptomyces parvulus]